MNKGEIIYKREDVLKIMALNKERSSITMWNIMTIEEQKLFIKLGGLTPYELKCDEIRPPEFTYINKNKIRK